MFFLVALALYFVCALFSAEDLVVIRGRRGAPPSEQKFSCVFLACEAYFHSKDALKWHIKFSHSDIRIYCDVCSLEFRLVLVSSLFNAAVKNRTTSFL